MSPELAGYQLGEPVDHDGQTVTYAGSRLADHAPVLVVLPRSAHPAPETLDQLRAQFALLNRFGHPGVIRALALESTPDGVALVTDRPAAQSLRTLLTGQPLPLDRFLALGAEMAAAVAAVHAAGVIHRDLTPERFAVADGRPVVLGGFGRATPVPRQMHAAVSPGALAGTLTYLSPEQTGRMNRSVDFRTDLYSLGVILYEMLTGQPPFRANDPLQLIHAHIARAPQPPGQVRPNCPEPLAAIVLKLLAKSAEDRYQSAAGLEADLRLCLDQMRAGRTVPELIAGQSDVPSRFQVPERLYGRAAEVKQLLQAFEGIGPGRSSLVLISGYSGIGKSSLVQELQRPAMERQAHFVVGKFDQFKRNVPFATLHLALRDLVRQVMTEDDSRIAAYRDRLLTAAGPNGQLLIDVVPEFARLIGPQPAAPELPPQETRNRFQRLLHQVVRAFCSESHPLCLFIDDLQWVDSATLEWLESTMLDGDTGWLLLLGAYRDHEVSPSHPLRLLVDRLAETASAKEIQLQPLDDNTLAQLIADALHQSVGDARPLARIISEKTRGNPFFVNQLLDSLYREGAIRFDAASRRWNVDLEQAAGAAASDNVVDFMTTRLERLAPASRDTLHLAACLGSTFELETLVTVADTDRAALLASLDEPLAQGFVVPLSQSDGSAARLRFQHDRVQQAAYGLRTEPETRAVRLRAGRLMLDAADEPERDERLFDILQHLNIAADAITDSAEQERLARLNLAASARARAATAYEPALAHVIAAQKFAARAGLADAGELAFELALEQAECEHPLGHDQEAEAAFTRALGLAADDFARGRVYERQIHFFTNRAQFRRAFETGLEAARLFGIRLPPRFVPPLFIADFLRARIRLRGKDIPALVDGPVLSDQRQMLALRFMAIVSKCAFQMRPELCVQICTRIVNESLSHGNTADSTIGYLAYGVIFNGGILGNAKAGRDFGRLVLGLIDKFDNRQQRAEVNFVYGYFAHPWSSPWATTESYFRTAYQAGIDSGDFFHAGCACAGMVYNQWLRGASLTAVWDESEGRRDFLLSVQGHEPLGAVTAVRQAIRNLQGLTTDPSSFSDDEFDAAKFEPTLESYGSPHFAHIYWITLLQTRVLRGELEAARAAAERSARYLKSSAGLQQIADHHFWAAIAAARGRDPGAASLLRRAIRRHRRWARHAPDNFRDRQFILEGERAWLDERTTAALSWFERAAEAARQAGHLAIEGLASERAAEAADALERRRAARFHRTEALAAWRSWGAIALADSLLERHPELALRSSEAGTGGATSLDLFTVVKSSQAISGAVQLPVLLDTLLGIVLENAGAERGVLLLKEGAGFLVQADGKVGEPASTMQATPLAAYDGAAHSVINYVLHSRESAVIADATADPAWAHDPYVKRAGARSVLCAPLLRQGELTGVLYLENNATPGAFTAERLEILTLLSGQIAISLDNSQLVERLEDKVRERTGQLEARNQFIRRTFGRFLSDDIVDSLLDTSAGSHLGGEKRQVTILMADLRDFSVTAESLAPETVVTIINNYLGAMTEVIMAHQGTIDEFIGDAILAIFGAPTLRDDDAERAVACALAMQHTMTEVNARNRAAGLPEVSMGIGLHTGEVVVGSIGSEKRAKYGVVGAAVNLASRIESYTLPGQILMSESTRSAVSAPLRIDGERTVRPKGSPAPIVLYDVGGIGGAWQVELNRQKSDPLLTLPEPVPVAWAPLEGKSMTRQPQPASIVALAPSQESCRIVLGAADAAAPEPLTNIWLTLDPSAADAGDGRSALFGKVLLSDPLGFTVRFSSVPEWARAALQPYIADDDELSDADTANTAVSPNSLRSPESRP